MRRGEQINPNREGEGKKSRKGGGFGYKIRVRESKEIYEKGGGE